MSNRENSEAISLVDAALKAGLAYEAMWTAMLRGEVRGFRGAGNRWLIDCESLEEFLTARGGKSGKPATLPESSH